MKNRIVVVAVAGLVGAGLGFAGAWFGLPQPTKAKPAPGLSDSSEGNKQREILHALCEASEHCARDGACWYVGPSNLYPVGTCEPGTASHCQASTMCEMIGYCQLQRDASGRKRCGKL